MGAPFAFKHFNVLRARKKFPEPERGQREPVAIRKALVGHRPATLRGNGPVFERAVILRKILRVRSHQYWNATSIARGSGIW